MRSVVVLVCVLLAAAPVAAQSTYVGAALVGDIARYSKVESESRRIPGVQDSLDGETLSLGVTVGRAIGDNWGVELEFVRSGEIERRVTYPSIGFPIPLPRGIPAMPGVVPVLPGGTTVPGGPFPVDFSYEEEIEQRQTSLGTLAWVRHDIGRRVQLSYLGGISFFRTEIERESNGPRILIYPPVDLETESTDYQVAPTVGVDGQFSFGEHTALVTGVRLHSLSVEGRRGFLIRPSVGLRWKF
jgi:hypothetical protein